MIELSDGVVFGLSYATLGVLWTAGYFWFYRGCIEEDWRFTAANLVLWPLFLCLWLDVQRELRERDRKR